ncbi:hypothetical protein TNCV_4226021 [Trichonephila clavipes]|uniref:Uncharacterized protein n=1 Tax=Trichonephila clavipes TaxID=2585209 RepID=A0A8X6VRB6_TRICX|nr:hypothetical protein TNCV_4226021 [Trichonephila clavipes]
MRPLTLEKSSTRSGLAHGKLPKLTPSNRGYVQGKLAIGDTWSKSGKPYADSNVMHFKCPLSNLDTAV